MEEPRALRETQAGAVPWTADAHALRRREARRRASTINLTLDTAMLVSAAAVAAWSGRRAGIPVEPLPWIVGYIVLVLFALRARGLHSLHLDASVVDDVARIVVATATAAMAVIAARVTFESDADTARQTVRLWGFSAAYLAAGRTGLQLAVRRARRNGVSAERAIIVGGGRIGRLVAGRLLERPEIGLTPVGFVDKEPLPPEAGAAESLPVLGASWDLEQIVREHDVTYAVITFSTAPDHVMARMARRCQDLGLGVLVIPRLFEGVNNRVYVQHLGGLPLLAVRPVDPKGWRFTVKHAFDRVMAAAILTFVWPVLLAGAVAVKLSSPGPVLFRQRRVGRDGREFDMLKFRTMSGDPAEAGEADSAWAAGTVGGEAGEQPVAAGERRTRVGTFLRRWSLDELPQLLNVLKGDMSLVGPRPERTSYVELFAPRIHRYDDRHRVKSGMTGWAQVHGLRGETSLADRIEWDNYYIENWSILLDLKILLMTVAAVARGSR